jgi:hypothetical protein
VTELRRFERLWELADDRALSEERAGPRSLAINNRLRTAMGGPGAPVDLITGQPTQTWLGVSDEPPALVSGRYWHHLRQEQPAVRQSIQNFKTGLSPEWPS